MPRIETLEAFEQAFALLGYAQRTTDALESGNEKIALFIGERGVPTHAARQLANGLWTSKLGQDVDLVRELSALEGPAYGKVGAVLARTVERIESRCAASAQSGRVQSLPSRDADTSADASNANLSKKNPSVSRRVARTSGL